jgi:hypothetical protein
MPFNQPRRHRCAAGRLEICYAVFGTAADVGSIKAAVTIGSTRWKTSIFPNAERQSVLPQG